jgi:aspartate racemase
MTTIGLIGGIGPESTVDYYKKLIAIYQARKGDGSYPSIVINSIDLQAIVALVSANDLDGLITYLVREIERLAKAGAAYGALTANTPHIVFDDLARRSPIPLISIVEATYQAARSAGLRRLALLGTRFTMLGQFYPAVFAKGHLELVIPDSSSVALIHEKYMNELIKGNFLEPTRDQFIAIINTLRERDGIDGVILAGTELPLLLREVDIGGLPMLDTTEIHVEALVSKMLRA